ncbi:glycerol-3-phosphate dehydrogenase [Nocardia huaxiensis]|uniref:Glycerol-3-phosphate dehydrogenase n=1 Tax=Nocardia huaxiensis TaxID=2755382 RepID=A0A7D6Z410_9NOCA|nr:glycerol-3-phosphate dehydrogenase [Nocardia huaxiensis]QLY30604.1 glycerol-3-phosphate dehydrogenase [Nocardia huaxiensis]UFS95791.1 glycerol-3-phosphate dehydrogenase [Nocardia huaxiensis]
MSAQLDPAYRARAIDALGDTEIDVLVIGGGVTGAGAALDAASRGLSVALVEARDFAAGTSSRSSKLIHGGLRYLEQLDFALVREALKERGLLLNKLAPHLVRPVSFLFPLQHHVWERAYIGAGVALYDTLGGARSVPMHRHLTRSSALGLAPALKDDAMIGAIRYYDAQVDDARHTMMIARTAAQHGATVLTRTKVTGLLRDGEKVVGAKVLDQETGLEHTIRARTVISATGVWTDDMIKMTGVEFPFHVRMSKGVHIMVPRERLNMNTGLIMRTEKSVLFVIPWAEHWIIGTTDTDWGLDKNHPTASAADVQYILDHVNSLLREPLTRADIVGTYAGLRPLMTGANKETSKLSREHAVAEPAPGLFVIAGGKYTTYRVMASDVVDAAAERLGSDVAPSVTENLPILGAVGYADMLGDIAGVAARADLPAAVVEHLLGRYGSLSNEIFDLVAAAPELAQPIAGAEDYIAAEAVYAVTHEGALHLDDLLTRRTRISIEVPDRGLKAAPEIAALIAPHLGWDAERTNAEINKYFDRVHAELAANEAKDDETANAARMVAVS